VRTGKEGAEEGTCSSSPSYRSTGIIFAGNGDDPDVVTLRTEDMVKGG